MVARMPVLSIFMLIAMVSVVSLAGVACAQHRVDYDISILADGTARWRIVEADTSEQAVSNPFEDLSNRLALLLDNAKAETGRAMSFRIEQISVNFSGSYATVEYLFLWSGFCILENETITVGDVFTVANWSMQLYGDGPVSISYPSGWRAEVISPTPYRHDSSQGEIVWLGTLDFKEGEPHVVTREGNPSLGILETLWQNSVLITAVALMLVGVSSGLFIVRRAQNRARKGKVKPEPEGIPELENGEDMILRLLASSPRQTTFQSSIAEGCGFSKAKTSQLLAALEEQGKVRRYKKGRDKVVVLAGPEQSRGEPQ